MTIHNDPLRHLHKAAHSHKAIHHAVVAASERIAADLAAERAARIDAAAAETEADKSGPGPATAA
jgi:hypothetical protein